MTMKAAAVAIMTVLAASGAWAAQKSKKPADTISEAQKTNDASWRLVRYSLPIWLPTWAQPIYQKIKSDQETAAAKPAKAKSRER